MGVADLQYLGNTVVREWTGCPQAALDKLRSQLLAPPPSPLVHVLPTHHMASRRLGIGLDWQRIQRQVPPTGIRRRPRRGHPRRLEPALTKRAAETAALARELGVGEARAVRSIADLVADPQHRRPLALRTEPLPHRERRGDRRRPRSADAASSLGIACEKPLARTVAEAQRVTTLVKRAGLKHGYLENQVFAPQVEHGRTTLWARGARSPAVRISRAPPRNTAGRTGPGSGRGELQGGGVLNDMMCHSALLVRHLLTEPGAARRHRCGRPASPRTSRASSGRGPIRRASSRARWAPEVDYAKRAVRGLRQHDASSSRRRRASRASARRPPRGASSAQASACPPSSWVPSTRCPGIPSTAG